MPSGKTHMIGVFFQIFPSKQFNPFQNYDTMLRPKRLNFLRLRFFSPHDKNRCSLKNKECGSKFSSSHFFMLLTNFLESVLTQFLCISWFLFEFRQKRKTQPAWSIWPITKQADKWETINIPWPRDFGIITELFQAMLPRFSVKHNVQELSNLLKARNTK